LRRLKGDPDWFLADGADQVLKDDTATIALIKGEATRFVIKRYNTRGLLHLLRNALRKTRARRCWDNAGILAAAGIEAARSIAVIERRWGPFATGSYYVSEFVEGQRCQEHFRNIQDPDESEMIANNIAKMFRSLCDGRIKHGDMKAKNIIIRNAQPVLIDLDGLRRYASRMMYRYVAHKDVERFLEEWVKYPAAESLFRRIFAEAGLRRPA
jgi:tRNA A-37 threonylcarbamoyl transferase component Bud32